MLVPGKGSKNEIIEVTSENIKKDSILSKVMTKGIVYPEKRETIYATKSLKVKNILPEVGDLLTENQLIIVYDDKEKKDIDTRLNEAKLNLKISELQLSTLQLPASEIEVKEAWSQIHQAIKEIEDGEATLKQVGLTIRNYEKDLEEAERRLENASSLYDLGAISAEELNQKQKQVRSLREAIEKEKIQLEKTNLFIKSANQKKVLTEKNLENISNKIEDPKQKKQIEIQRNQVELSKLRIKELEKELENQITDTRSPIEGTLITLNAEKGTTLVPNSIIAEVANLSNLIVKADIPEYDAVNLKLNQEVKITGDSLGEGIFYKGFIKKIAPSAVKKRTATGEEVVIEVEISVIDKDTVLKIGYSVECEILTSSKTDVVVVPIISVIKEKDGSDVVFIIKDDMTVEKRVIKLGIYSNLYVEASGVGEGEKIITDPGPKLKDGVKVKIKTAANTK